jgi:SAM-dependent methyltransferase
MVRRFVTRGRLLEIGPGYGSFSWLAKSAGFDVEAIESDVAACEYLAHQIGVKVTKSAAPEQLLASRTTAYDAVVMWHVIEHLPDPWATLQQAARLLNAGGIILVATPNPSAWQFRVLGRQWPHIDAPRHLWLIPLDVLRRYLEPLGFELTFVTTNDPGAENWNRFGWSQTIVNLQPAVLRNSLLVKVASRVLGHAAAFAVKPWERADLQGSAYSAVFRKRVTAERSGGGRPVSAAED